MLYANGNRGILNEGALTYTDGKVAKGRFTASRMLDGQGEIIFPDGSKQTGSFVLGMKM